MKQEGFLPGANTLFQWYIPVAIRTQEERAQRRANQMEDEVGEVVTLGLSFFSFLSFFLFMLLFFLIGVV